MCDAICGGLIKESLFFSNPGAYMMNPYMKDSDYEIYQELKKTEQHNLARVFFDEHVRSAI